MLSSRRGHELKIVADCGMLYGPAASDRLVRVQYANGYKGYAFVSTLKADKGKEEIDAAIEAAPKDYIEGDELKKAVQEAC